MAVVTEPRRAASSAPSAMISPSVMEDDGGVVTYRGDAAAAGVENDEGVHAGAFVGAQSAACAATHPYAPPCMPDGGQARSAHGQLNTTRAPEAPEAFFFGVNSYIHTYVGVY